MGLVFASRKVTIHTDQLPLILGDDEYNRISRTELAEGDVVVYKYAPEGIANHIGVVAYFVESSIGSTTFVMSKWGDGPEYLHPMEDVPSQFGRPYEFWTDRRLPN
jgi:hypothetical protein